MGKSSQRDNYALSQLVMLAKCHHCLGKPGGCTYIAVNDVCLYVVLFYVRHLSCCWIPFIHVYALSLYFVPHGVIR